jgi:hypothetical protein
MLGVLWGETVSLGIGIPVMDIAAVVGGIVIALGSSLIAAALFSTDD